MKAMIRKTIVLFLATIAFTGCSKDDKTCDPNNEESPCYAGPSDGLFLLVEEKQSDFTYKYSYDDRNRMIRWDIAVNGGSGSWTYTYDESDRLIGIDIRDGQGTISGQYTYSYESGERPVSGTFGPIQILFIYTQNTTIETHILEGQTVGTTTYTYDEKGNLLSLKTENPLTNENYLSEYGDYDDKPSSHQMWPSFSALPPVNNYQSYKLTKTSGGHDHVYEYTYNDAGYPIKANIYDRQTEELVQTREYTYKKVK